jgi:hypothetical protein
MTVIEKHGADWYWSESNGEIVFEFYDSELDLIGLIYRRSFGHLIASIYEKKSDPWLEPLVWSEMGSRAVFDDIDEAKAHLKLLIENKKSHY